MITKHLLPCFTSLILPVLVLSQTISENIHIDQFGYLPGATKVAVLVDPQNGFNGSTSYIPGAILEVRDAQEHSVVFQGAPEVWDNGSIHSQSGDAGWWYDFSALTSPGSYYILDPTQNVRSFEFSIQEDLYADILKAAGRVFYYNRCNMAKETPYADTRWTDGPSFLGNRQDGNSPYLYDSLNTNLERDLSGGWFDAGDYNKYVTFAFSPVHDLLIAYSENPQVFTDKWNIPESGNGIPDILDEIKWELDWLMKMNNSDGSTNIKMGSTEHKNSASPPSINNRSRYYGPICTSASVAIAGMFAHAAQVFSELGDMANYVNELTQRAESSWNYVLDHLNNGGSFETNCDDGTINAGDADWSESLQKENLVVAAIYLWQLTDKSIYHQYIIDHIQEVSSIGGWWGPYTMPANEALLLYYQHPNADQNTSSTIINSLLPHVQQDWNGFFGINELDLYRSYMPDAQYHWGSNMVKAQIGNLNIMLDKYGIESQNSVSYLSKAAEHLHYFHGLNPLNLVYLSNMYALGGEHCANEIYHSWFADGTDYDHALNDSKGPAPGFVTGGPNKDFSIGSISPPSNQPPQKSYLDWNTAWPENSWEITEPAIYYQAAYLRLLANFTRLSEGGSTPTHIELSAEEIEIHPNPMGDTFAIRGILGPYVMDIYAADGRHIRSLENIGDEALINISGLGAGIYILHIYHNNLNELHVEQIIKL